MATAARFSAGAGSLAGSRANAAQRSAIFRRVVSSNGRVIPLDYNTPAIDEMPQDLHSPPRLERPDMTDKAAEQLKSSGWTIVDTTGFISLVGPLWQRVVDNAHEYALVAGQAPQPPRPGAGRAVDDVRGSQLRHDGAIRIGPADTGDGPARHPFCRQRQDRRYPDLQAARGPLHPQPDFRDHRGDRRQALYCDGQRRVQDIEE